MNQRQVDLRGPLLGAARWQSDRASARADEGNVMIGCYILVEILKLLSASSIKTSSSPYRSSNV